MSIEPSSTPQSQNGPVIRLDPQQLILASLAFGLPPMSVISGVFRRKKNGSFEIDMSLTDGHFRYFERPNLTSEHLGDLHINRFEIVVSQSNLHLQDGVATRESVTRVRSGPQTQWMLVVSAPSCGTSNPYFSSIPMHDVPQFENRMRRVHRDVHSYFGHMI